MKKYIILLLFVAVAVTGTAQGIRHVKGINSVELGVGGSSLTKLGYGSFVHYFGRKVYGKASAFYVMGEDKGYKFNSIGIDLAPALCILPIGETFFLNGTGGLAISMDRLNPAVDVYDDNGNVTQEAYGTLKFGAFIGLETETFISDKFVLIIGANKRFVSGTEFGSNRWYAFGGIRYNF